MLIIKNIKKFDGLERKINKVQDKIKESLQIKIPYYEKINGDLNKDLCKGIDNLDLDTPLTELDDKEVQFDKNILNYIESKKKFNPSEETKEAINSLYEENINCEAYKKYYNDLAKQYNSLSNKMILKIFKRSKPKILFNETKEERFEILKKK